MKRAILEATESNILNSIKENTFNRNMDIKDFVEALDTIEGNMFISLDAQWGGGKTFYVRQIESTLDFLTKRMREDDNLTEVENLRPYFQNTVLDSINLKQSYLPIYYNAWLYDNHDDPLMSLIYIIVKKFEHCSNTKISKTIEEKVSTLLSAASVSLNGFLFSFGVNGEKIRDAISTEDILINVKTAEQIRQMVKEILDEVITERAQRLVIFLDELDRCRPSYAIDMLERIKHYFDDERIIFIVSINKEQLVCTISKYYGYGFDSTGYLNKFFDLNVHLPEVDTSTTVNIYNSQQYFLKTIANGLNEHYKLSLRDSLIFYQRVSELSARFVNDGSSQGCCFSLFIPIIMVLDLKNEDEKIKFLNGNSDILKEYLMEVPAITKFFSRFGEGNGEAERKEINGYGKIKKVYEYIFKEDNRNEQGELPIDISYDFKRLCFKLCNGFER